MKASAPGVALLLGIALAGLGRAPVSAGAADPPLMRVFVHLPTGLDQNEVASLDLEGLGRSVVDLRKALEAHKKTFVVVDSADKADLSVAVLDRSITVPRFAVAPAVPIDQPGAPQFSQPVRIVHLKVKAVLAGRVGDFASKNSPVEAQGGWQAAAEDVVKQLEKWVRQSPGRPSGGS